VENSRLSGCCVFVSLKKHLTDDSPDDQFRYFSILFALATFIYVVSAKDAVLLE